MKNAYYFLKGKKVELRAIGKEDIPLITRWLNDEIVTYFMIYGQKPTSQEQVAEWIQKEHLDSPENTVFMAVELKTKKPIGFTGLYGIHQTAHRAEFRILIGEKDFWGKGYGTEVTELVTFYGLDRLNLNRIYLGFVAENKAVVRTYVKAGYSYEGVSREEVYRNSRYYDGYRMAILRKDYYKKYYPNNSKRFKSSWNFSEKKSKR